MALVALAVAEGVQEGFGYSLTFTATEMAAGGRVQVRQDPM